MQTTSNLFDAALIPFSGVQRDSFNNPNNIIVEAVRQVNMNVDITESKKIIPLTQAVYTGDYLYALPTDVDTVISLTPIDGKFSSWDEYMNRDARSMGLDTSSFNNSFRTEYRQGTRLMRITGNHTATTPIVLHNCDSLDDNGTVTATADANNIGINEINFMDGVGSVDFNITPSSGIATIVFDGIDRQDISSITRDGSFSMMLDVPADLAGKITSVRIRLGNDSSNYLQQIVTMNAFNGSFTQGYNPVRFERRTATTTGTVDNTAIDYMEVSIIHTASTNVIGVKIDHIIAEKGVAYALAYYSNLYYTDESGVFIERPSSVGLGDSVIFNGDTFALVVEEMKKLMDFELKGDNAGSIWQSAFRTLMGTQGNANEDGLYAQYKRRWLSERKPNISYYE
jgi:hypothetical protein